jgi:hypothetical protein
VLLLCPCARMARSGDSWGLWHVFLESVLLNSINKMWTGPVQLCSCDVCHFCRSREDKNKPASVSVHGILRDNPRDYLAGGWILYRQWAIAAAIWNLYGIALCHECYPICWVTYICIVAFIPSISTRDVP